MIRQRPALAGVLRPVDVVGEAGLRSRPPEIVVDEIHVSLVGAAFVLQLAESPEALRKRLSRAVGRITRELGLDEFDDE